jgi:hypothetical protein
MRLLVAEVLVLELALYDDIYIFSYGRTRQQGGGRITIDKWVI